MLEWVSHPIDVDELGRELDIMIERYNRRVMSDLELGGRPIMSRWTHSCCDGCWPAYAEKIGRAGVLPMRMRTNVPKEKCCYCGVEHQSGVYVRDDPETTSCKGMHNGAS
jgi:hypothetical protein